MKEALVSTGPIVKIVDSPIPSPGPGQVLIKVVVCGSNPKDWKTSEIYGLESFNSSEDIAGLVHAVGPGVTEFKPGDRVAAMHMVGGSAGCYAEYALGQADLTCHLPEGTSFEGAATIPLAAMTAAVLVFRGLGIPDVWSANRPIEDTPFVLWGGASAVGAFSIQLARRSGIHPIIAVAVGYRKGDDVVVQAIRATLKGTAPKYGLDAVRVDRSYLSLATVLDPITHKASANERVKMAVVLPLPNEASEPGPAGLEAGLVESFKLPRGVEPIMLGVNLAHSPDDGFDRDFEFVYTRYMARGLQDGWFKPHPYEVQLGGLAGVQEGLRKLKMGHASAIKYVYRIVEIS
ncbi:chaperonin 10-like protein [Fusarium acuminatum]|uniref:Chaperonin 10-like protein n=1 Tax=Fusarium acuminatum TaxID=5515 RepID=A0ABZ2WMX5_9HYPO